MGHERTGALPPSKPWRDVVAQMASFSGSAEEVAALAQSTLENVRTRFQKLHRDAGVIAAFQFLIALAKSASSDGLLAKSFAPAIDFDGEPSTLQLVKELRSWVDTQQGSREYADIAKKASADAIMLWSEKQSEQPTLFSNDYNSKEIWQRADSSAGFCEVSRLFFAKFTERYLHYFLDREASAALTSIRERDHLGTQLREHIDGVSNYAFEASRITQSFAAGWFSNHAREKFPSHEESAAFLSIAFGKMQEELLREASRDE